MKPGNIANHRIPHAVAAVMLLATSGISLAQTSDEILEEITVTGSYIKGSSTTDALPVVVVGRNEIELLGSPTTADIVNDMTINTGSENYSNALGGQNRNTGPANVNLRGLGLAKTLILINGKRQTIHSTSAGSGATMLTLVCETRWILAIGSKARPSR